MPDNAQEYTSRLIPLTDWNNCTGTHCGLRHLVFNAKSNGFDRVVKQQAAACS